jgi:hypothetical protein
MQLREVLHKREKKLLGQKGLFQVAGKQVTGYQFPVTGNTGCRLSSQPAQV